MSNYPSNFHQPSRPLPLTKMEMEIPVGPDEFTSGELVPDSSPKGNLFNMTAAAALLTAMNKARETGASEVIFRHPVDNDIFNTSGEQLSFRNGDPTSLAELDEPGILANLRDAVTNDPQGTAELLRSAPEKYQQWVKAIQEARTTVGGVKGIFRPPAVSALTSALDEATIGTTRGAIER